MKNYLKKIIIMIAAAASICLYIGAAVSCSYIDDQKPLPVEPKVIVEENNAEFDIIGKNPLLPDENGNVVVVLAMKEKFFVSKVINPLYDIDVSIEKDGGADGEALIKIKNIKRVVRVKIECLISGTNIFYYPNGGTILAAGDQKEYYVTYSLLHHFRPNTEIGTDKIVREGYVQTGWNAKADGSGEHTGLGSRVTVKKDESLKLYAEWSKWTDTSSFVYSNTFETGMTITGYTGSHSEITIPEYLDGKNIDTIAAGAFNGLAANKIILPKGLKNVADGAFKNCSFKELYLYDDIERIADSSFVNCNAFKTLHINAIEPPRYVTNDRHSNLADKYDILILNKDVKKLVVLGGSGTYYSIDTMQIEKSFPEYVCINMGVNGWFNGAAQFEMIIPYLSEGDVFVHAPEASSQYQLMYQTDMYFVNGEESDNRFFGSLELNYDLLSLVDVRNVTALFDAFKIFNDVRAQYSGQKYEEFISFVDYNGGIYLTDTGFIDERGNYAPPQPPAGTDMGSGEADVVSGYIKNPAAIERLNGYYSKIREKGAAAYIINAAVNQDTLRRRVNDPAYEKFKYYPHPEKFPITIKNYDYLIMDFDETLNANLTAPNILNLSACLYPTEAFCGSDYHLSDDSVIIHTNKIISALRRYIAK